eukprot:Trichotokara_eunicae@DN5250_c0_g1_i3.p2
MRLVVPSDVSIAERRLSNGTRKTTVTERIGLALFPPTFHWRFTKIDKGDMKDVLKRKYPQQPPNEHVEDALDVVKRRQESVSKRVRCQAAWVGGAVSSTVAGTYFLRHFDYKSKGISLAMMAYMGGWGGWLEGNLWTQRFSEPRRDRWLGRLPGKSFFKP